MQNEIDPKVEIQEVDHEGAMARADLYRAAKMSMKLFQMIQDGQQLEGWVQAKITKSADYLDSIYHYMEYQVKFGQGAQVSSVEDITSEPSIVAQHTKKSEKDDEEEMKESHTSYEQRLHSLLESAMKKEMKKKSSKDEKVKEATGDYSAKKARAGKDIGKPGKQFSKIAKKAGEKYGSKERGEKVAGAVLKKLRAKEDVQIESKKAKKDYDGDGKIESPKDEVWGSRAKAAAKSGKPFAKKNEGKKCR